MPEFLKVRYGHRCYRFLSYYALFAVLVLWIGAALFAGGLIISQVMSWPYWVAVVTVGAFATSYTAVGGLKAVVRTDVYQSVLIIAASCILTLLALSKIGGIGKLAVSVPPGYWDLFQGSESPYPWYAMVLGYPVIGIQYWCTDQTIVQRVLGAKNTTEGQKGALFTAFLKVLMPFIFIFPGVMCFVLYPGLKNPDHAYMTLITGLLPVGFIGLVVAALFAALINTVASALNSFSTLFTLDVYKRVLRPEATDGQIRSTGQWITVASALVGAAIAIFFGSSQKNLFELVQGVAAYVAPPLSTVFVVGVLWKRATPKAAEWTLIGGGLLCIMLGIFYILDWPRKAFWPPFMLFTFYLFVLLVIFMVAASLLTKPQPQYALPTLKETYARSGEGSKRQIWLLWGLIAIVMITIYIVFN
jgi:SSS family solute:Na+ symporter